MKQIRTTGVRRMFEVLPSSDSVQAAVMILRAGQASSEHPENEHPRSEQWLYVISGAGTAAEKRTLKLRPGSLLLIEKAEKHQIRQSGKKPLVTLNFYAPPAYSLDGDVLLSARTRLAMLLPRVSSLSKK